MAVVFDKMSFEGPFPASDPQLPPSPGIYIVSTMSSGGVRMLGIYQAEDMLADFRSHGKRACWEKGRDEGLDVYHRVVEDRRERDSACRKMIDDRWYQLECVDPPRDDF